MNKKQKLAALRKQIQAIRDGATASERALEGDELAKVEALLGEAETLKAEIDAEEHAAEVARRIEAQVSALDEIPAPRSVARNDALPAGAEPVRAARALIETHDNVQDDPRRGFRSMGDFGDLVARASNPSANLAGDDRQRLFIGAAATGMSQGVGADGGFLVPPEFSTQIWDGMNQSPENLLSLCDVYTVDGESLTFNANAETSRATGSRWGGVRSYWIAEAAQIANSKPTFRQVKLEPQQLAVLCYATDKLLRSAQALDQYLTRAASDEIMWEVNEAIIAGNGVGKPLGILNSPALVSVAKESNQAADTIVKANVDKAWSRMHPRSRAGARWFNNVDTEPQLENLSMNVGTGGVPVYLPPGGIADTPNARLKGRQVLTIEHCPTLGDLGDLILADLSAYAVGVKGGVEAAMSMHLRFDYAENAFRFMFAVDGQPWLASAITPAKGAATLSPFVAVAERA